MDEGHAEGCIHTVYSDGRWKNKVEGAAPLPGWYDRQEIAAEAGRAYAIRGQAEHVIRNEDGTVAQRVSHRREPLHGVAQPEVERETGLAYAIRRLAELLLHDRDGSIAERQEGRRDAARRPAARRPGGAAAVVGSTGEGSPGR